MITANVSKIKKSVGLKLNFTEIVFILKQCCVNIRKYIASQVSIAWYNTVIFIQS